MMELEGHPTHDIIEELKRRGGVLYKGTSVGPDKSELEEGRHLQTQRPGLWLWVPTEAFETEIDERPRL